MCRRCRRTHSCLSTFAARNRCWYWESSLECLVGDRGLSPSTAAQRYRLLPVHSCSVVLLIGKDTIILRTPLRQGCGLQFCSISPGYVPTRSHYAPTSINRWKSKLLLCRHYLPQCNIRWSFPVRYFTAYFPNIFQINVAASLSRMNVSRFWSCTSVHSTCHWSCVGTRMHIVCVRVPQELCPSREHTGRRLGGKKTHCFCPSHAY